MWSSLLLYGGLFVAFGFLSGSLIWLGLVTRRSWQQRAADARGLQPSDKPSTTSFPATPQQALHTTKLGPAANAHHAWPVNGAATKPGSKSNAQPLAARTKPATKLLNFPR